MGMLRNSENEDRVLLRGNHVFGRHPARSDTVLPNREASQLHAMLRWRDGGWFVTDHSRNGTLIDGRRLPPGEAVPLALGQVLRFGPGAADWDVVDLSPPGPALLPLDPVRPPLWLSRHNLLPDAEAPELDLYELDTGLWMLEQQGELRSLQDGDELELGGARYRLVVPQEVDETRAVVQQAEPLLLSFRVSLDEEHTWLQVRRGLQAADLGERSHHYALLTLARQRLADARAGLDPAAQGWLERPRLARMLGMDPPHLNIQIFRARDQLMNALAGASGLAQVIEGRRGGLRLGPVAFEIHRGSQLEGRMDPASDALA
ncbi:FHA domain-containing protein [Azohydromonas caseinilytica]|uniref:FHA domain-containing protein n=1 Tax=Azohydromonas caseinilytica TaxID=2728836 RepID=A0A848F9R7_9BURK|nr:FHA domain-containing protein [Azohydromonas caseinilytica]NML16907.1 FHA domain-containing protein [Azohydromonas caseinilytica]